MSVHTPSKPLPSHPRRLSWLPTTRMGWRGLTCAVLAPILLLVPNLVFGPGPEHPVSVVCSLAAFVLAVAAPVLTVMAALRRHERSIILIALSTVLALFVVAFFLGELLLEGG